MPSSSVRIRSLPQVLVDQIAAGEVVERPSSVVKELVENALDSGACNVSVDLTAGGLAAIVVTDDGHGMDAADLRAAVVRHATSKIACLGDLSRLHTFGFRGEALSSIAAVSRLTLTSRRADARLGCRLTVVGGTIESALPMGCPVGTSLAVRDLFFNVPARRKFLRAALTEQAHVHDSLLKTALGRRADGFVLTAGGRTLLDVPPDAPHWQRPQLALGRRYGLLRPFVGPPGPVAVSGFVAPPSSTKRPEAQAIWLFVNGRPIRDRTLQRACVAGYQAVHPQSWPQALLYVDLPSELVDVNVHPQKAEVRFADGAAIYQAVVRAVALATAALSSAGRLELGEAAQANDGLARRDSAAGGDANDSPAPSEGGQSGGRGGGGDSFGHNLRGDRASNDDSEARPSQLGLGAQLWQGLAAHPRRNAPGSRAVRGATDLPGLQHARATAIGPAAESQRAAGADGRRLAGGLGADMGSGHQTLAPCGQGSLLALEPPSWQRLRPLAVAPKGYLCCLAADQTLVLVRLATARAAVAAARLQGGMGGDCDARAWPSERVLLPPSWRPPAAQAAALAQEGALQQLQACGLVLEAIGPDAYVLTAVPTLWLPAKPVAVAEALLACWSPPQVAERFGANAAELPERWAERWQEGIAHRGGWPEQQQVAMAAWAPALLAALAHARVPAQAPVLANIDADHPALSDAKRPPAAAAPFAPKLAT